MNRANARPVRTVPTEEITRRLLRDALAENPLKRVGYEDAREDRPSIADNLTEHDALKYEEGRLLYAEIAAIGRPPVWDRERPPDPLVALCVRWMSWNPGGAVVPPSFGVSDR